MVKKPAAVPDAWDDDWEAQADRLKPEDKAPESEPSLPRSKSERLAQHVEENRKLWESAESTETFHYLETTTNTVPLASNFKPQVKVLSRRPVIAKRDPTTGMSQMTLDDDNDAPKKETPMTPEEIRAKQKREREEKQRRYEETRAKIFGESAPSSGASTPGTVTPPRPDGQSTPRGGRGRGRGGGQSGQRSQEPRHFEGRRQDIQSTSSRELFDPNLPSQAEPSSQGREGRESPARNLTPKNEHAPIRNPRGPDASGRGGFNLARRGAREG